LVVAAEPRLNIDLEEKMVRALALVLGMLVVLAGIAGGVIYSGAYDIGADAPHSPTVYSILEELRERSIASHARGIAVPRDLNDRERVSAGATLYAEMCTGCHLGPGLERSELSQGLYPAAPELARGDDLSAAEQFWTIKHGVKLTAMPAWGKTHSDELIWDMVAFLRQLPKMSPAQYRRTVASAPEDHEEMMEAMKGEAAHAPPKAAEELSHHHEH
jgi:mono/diheme cytochrome c family protein